MRIDALDLKAFGPFTDVALDLAAGDHGLHVIYGPNEAGKTTALRAIQQALFGIPPRSTDDFVHAYQNLRIGATLSRRDGSRLAFVRRKGTRNTLLAADGLSPLDEAALRPYLDGVDRETFETMFGIDHAQLVRGGSEIVRGGGQVGQVLFAAGAGIADLQRVQDALRDEAEAFFAPRGTNRQINQLLRHLQDARRRQKENVLSSDVWAHHDQALQAARSARDEVERQLHQVRRDAARLERLVQALPLVARRRDLAARRAELGDVTLLRAEFADQRRAATNALEVASGREQAAREELLRLDEQLRTIHVPEALAARSQELSLLPQSLGSYRKAQHDLPTLRLKRDHLLAAAASLLRTLRPGLALEMADQLRLSTAQEVALRDLGTHCEALVQALDQARHDVRRTLEQIAQAEAELQAVAVPGDPAPLRDAVRRAQAQGDLEQLRAAAAADERRILQQAQRQLQRLPHWSGSLEQLERLAVPSLETVQQFDDELAQAQQRLRQLEEKSSAAADAWAECQKRLDASRLAGDVPTEDDLAEARRLRDEGWRLVLDAWQGRPADPAGEAAFLARLPGADGLAAAYPRSVAAADQAADRLRREAARVATHAGLLAERNSLVQQRAALDELLAAARRQHDDLLLRWQQAWHLDAAAGTPREMRAWLEQHRQLLQSAENLRHQQAAIAELDARIERHRAEVQCCRGDLLGQEPPAADSLAALLGQAQAEVDRLEAALAARRQLQQSLRQLAAQRTASEARAAKAEEDLERWRLRWAQALLPLGLPPDATPAEANAVLGQLGELFGQLREIQGIADRIAGIDHDALQFQAQVRQLAADVDPSLPVDNIEAAADELARRVQRAAGDQRQQQSLLQARKRKQADCDEARAQVTEAAGRLKALCLEAGCPDPAQLPELERRSEQALQLDRQRTELEEQLLRLAGGGAVDDLVAEADGANADELPGQLDELRELAQRLDERRRELSEQIGGEEKALQSMRGSAAAVEAGEEVQDLLARLESDAVHYARLRLASAVLRGGIDRYRRRNEGPVLRRASELFRQLTLGRFQCLTADCDEQGQQVLKGVRQGGSQALELAAMSEGTADQLYLALRLASLEQAMDGREPFPFIVDDILITFDNDRAAAALRVLADLSQRTQVLFFTHHQHLLELAASHVPAGQLFVHRLQPCGVPS